MCSYCNRQTTEQCDNVYKECMYVRMTKFDDFNSTYCCYKQISGSRIDYTIVKKSRRKIKPSKMCVRLFVL